MRNKTKFNSFLIIITIAVIVVCTVVFLFFIEPKEDDFFHLNADINYDGSTGLGETKSNEITVEASGKKDVYISFKVSYDNEDYSNSVLRIEPENLSHMGEYLSNYADGTTFEVSIDKVKSTTAVLILYGGYFYLVDANDTSIMHTLSSDTGSLYITFSLPITFADEIPKEVVGQKIDIKMTGKMINSASRLNKLKTIQDFKPYFDTMTTPIKYTSELLYSVSSDGKSAVLTGVSSTFNGNEIIVPAYTKIDGVKYWITDIANNAFASNKTIESVWFSPDSKITHIGENAFYNCTKLTSFTIPSSVNSIANNAFYQSYHLAEILNLSSLKLSLGSDNYGKIAFYAVRLSDIDWSEIVKNNDYYFVFGNDGTNYLLGYMGNESSIALPSDSKYKVKNYAFGNSDILTSISIPSGVYSIGKNAFDGCTNLISANIAGGVKNIEDFAFNGCTKLTHITFAPKGELTSIGNYAFNNCTSLQDITLPVNVKTLGKYALNNCSKLKSFTTVENSKLQSIETYTFSGCGSLQTLNLAQTSDLAKISEYAFKNCTALEGIIVPKNVKTIEQYAFYNCNKLNSFTVPTNCRLQSLNTYTFYNCTALKTVTFGEGSVLSTIQNNVFSGCINLSSIAIPSSVTSIGSQAFYGCTGLNSITFEDESKLTDLGERAFYGCSSLINITIPKNLVNIGNNAFSNCSSLTEIIIPDDSMLTSIEWIKPYTFLTSINISKNVIDISNYAFNGFTALQTITIADASKLTSIGDYAFYNCEKLKTVTFKGTSTLQNIGDYAFSECASYLSVALPASLKSVGQKAFFKTLKDYYSNNTVTYNITISDNMYLDSVGTYAFYHCRFTGNLHFSDKLKSISDYAFAYCYYGLNSVSFSANSVITSIGQYAFVYCYNLTTLSFGNDSTIQTVSDYAFRYCSLLESISFGSGCTIGSLGRNSFSHCISLSSIAFDTGATLQSIGGYAFEYCSKLTSIVLPEGTTSIADYTFYECRNLTSITLPNTLTSASGAMFTGCYRLAEIINKSDLDITSSFAVRNVNSGTTNVFDEGNYKYITCEGKTYLCGQYSGSFALPTNRPYYIKPHAFHERSLTATMTIPSNVQGIGQSAFYGCDSLVSVTISNNVKYIDEYAFYDCEGLTTISIPNSVESIGNCAFANCEKLHTININSDSNLVEIETSAFNGCRGLVSFTLPSGLGSIGNSAFSGCHRLAEIINFSTLSIDIGSEEKGGVAYNAVRIATTGSSIIEKSGDYETIVGSDGKTYIVAYYGNEREIEIPSCYGICGGAFYGNDRITSITIPSGLNVIGNYAFYDCDYISTLSIPKTVTKIGDLAFYGCDKVNTIAITNDSNLVSIGSYAFGYLNQLTTITIPSKVTNIGDRAFLYCFRLAEVLNRSTLSISRGSTSNGYVGYYAVKIVNNNTTTINTDNGFSFVLGNDNNKYLIGYSGTMTSVTIPSCYGIRYGAFYDNDTITAVTIPSTVTFIDDYAFYHCNKLKTVTFSGTPKLTRIDKYAFSNCSSLEKCNIPSKVAFIGERAFANTKLTSVTIPSSVTSLGKEAFYSCGSLTKLSIGSGVKTINDGTFAYTSLTSVTIPSTVTCIYAGAFKISTLESVTFQSEQPPSFGYSSTYGYDIFPSESTILSIYVPDKYYDTYIKSSSCSRYNKYIKKASERR